MLNLIMEQSGNPFDNIKKIEDANELLDIAFSRANKVRAPSGKMSNIDRSRFHEINRINMIVSIVNSRLEFIIHKFPSINLLHPFYRELAQIYVDLNEVKLILGRINGATETIRHVQEEITNDIQTTASKEEVKIFRKRFYGRIASILDNIDESLKFMKEVNKKLMKLPSFNPNVPCIVMCGFPNTGKSSFIKLVTSGKPEVASYPFTTKKLIFGHRKFGFIPIQFVDTPGILDRPLSERNSIELQAITAFQFLADILFFLIDPTPTAETDVETQIKLYKEINDYYPELKIIPVISKIDLISTSELDIIKEKLAEEIDVDELHMISIKTNSGIDQILSFLSDHIKKLMRQPKYRTVRSFEIAEDQQTLDQMNEITY